MVRSNLAYDETKFGYAYSAVPEREHTSNLRIRTAPKTKTSQKIKQAPKSKAKIKAHKKANLALVLLAAVAFLVLCRGVMITEKSDRLETKKEELKAITTANQKTQIEIDSALNLKNVEDVATNRLNMARPEKHQTVYIKIEQDDVVEKTDGAGAKEAVTEFFGMLKAYLD